jgi:hypothetical protein
MPEKKHGYATWDEALAEALELVRTIPLEHNVYEVSFGTFHDSVGGGHWLSIVANYSIGNTKPISRPAGDVEYRSRTARVLAAWRKRALEGSDG